MENKWPLSLPPVGVFVTVSDWIPDDVEYADGSSLPYLWGPDGVIYMNRRRYDQLLKAIDYKNLEALK